MKIAPAIRIATVVLAALALFVGIFATAWAAGGGHVLLTKPAADGASMTTVRLF